MTPATPPYTSPREPIVACQWAIAVIAMLCKNMDHGIDAKNVQPWRLRRVLEGLTAQSSCLDEREKRRLTLLLFAHPARGITAQRSD